MVILRNERFFDELENNDFSAFEELKQFIIEYLTKRFYNEGWFYKKERETELCLTTAEYLTEAIIEDIYVETIANDFFERCDYDEFKSIPDSQRVFNKGILNDIIKATLEGKEEEKEKGLFSYTSKHTFSKSENFKESMKRNYDLLMKHVYPELYKKIYPVFWLMMLDVDHSKKYGNEEFWKIFLFPFCNDTNLEEYIFSLLAKERKTMEKDDTIFTLVKKKMTRRFKDKKEIFNKYEEKEIERRKKVIEECEKMGAETYCSMRPGILGIITRFETIKLTPTNLKPNLFTERMECLSIEIKPGEKTKSELYREDIEKAKEELEEYINAINQKEIFFPDMRLKENRMYFVNVFRDILLNEKNPGNRKKEVLKNNLYTLQEIIKIGCKHGLEEPDPELFLYFLNRLTGWINFYLYVNSKDKRNTNDWYVNIHKENMIAVSYCVKENFYEYDEELLDIAANIYGSLLNKNIELVTSKSLDCKIYKKLYNEMIKEFEKSYTGGVIDVLDYYYNLYIKEWIAYEVGESFSHLYLPEYMSDKYQEEENNRRINEEKLKDKARHLLETILETNAPSDVLNVLRTSFDDTKIKLF